MMESLAFFFGLILLALAIGSILGWLAFFQARHLREENRKMQAEIGRLKADKIKAETLSNNPAPIPVAAQAPEPPETETPPEQVYSAKLEQDSESGEKEGLEAVNVEEQASTKASPEETSLEEPGPKENSLEIELPLDNLEAATQANTPPRATQPSPTVSPIDKFIQHLITHWMIWAGGASIGFAGIFLVKYSIDQGWLGPMARLLAGLFIGVALHAVAFRLHQRKGPNPVFAALAGGASLTLYAVVLAALHLYQFVSPLWAFAFLAVFSLSTMLLALIHGPVLAGLGILGAYLVPIFVSTGSNNLAAALTYSFIVTVSALLLLRLVAKHWLWVGTLIGAGCWWALSLTVADIDLARFAYLLALAYTTVAISHWDWRLQRPLNTPNGENKNFIVLALIVVALLMSLVAATQAPQSLWITALIPVVLIWLGRQHARYLWLSWASLVAFSLGLFMLKINGSSYLSMTTAGEIGSAMQTQWLLFLALLAAIYLVGGLWAMRSTKHQGYWASLGYTAPLILLILAYMLINASNTSWKWSAVAIAIGMVYFNILYRKRQSGIAPEVMAVLIIAGHFAYSLAVVMLTREATLTLALAAQLISLAWVDRHLPLRVLPYLIKGVLAAVILRLTLNPWLLSYPSDIHWTLWTYGGSLVCCLIAIRLLKNRHELTAWLQGGALHLFALTLITETRYQLYGGEILSASYSFFEASFYTFAAGMMGLVYRVREKTASHLARLYHYLAQALFIIALANYVLFLLLLKNPYFNVNTDISATPIFNLLLLAYGVPCLIAGATFYWYKNSSWRRPLAVLTAISIFIFVTLEIRHLWHPTEMHIDIPITTGELYTYSMVWLLMAIGASLISVRYRSSGLYKGSMIFLVLVVLKIFLIDTSGLTNLWRVASFMGLGIALLALAYFHQKIRVNIIGKEPDDSSTDNTNIERG